MSEYQKALSERLLKQNFRRRLNRTVRPKTLVEGVKAEEEAVVEVMDAEVALLEPKRWSQVVLSHSVQQCRDPRVEEHRAQTSLQ